MSAARERLLRHPAVVRAMNLFDATLIRVERIEQPEEVPGAYPGAETGEDDHGPAETLSDPSPADSAASRRRS